MTLEAHNIRLGGLMMYPIFGITKILIYEGNHEGETSRRSHTKGTSPRHLNELRLL